VRIHRRPVDHGVAGAAVPAGVSSATVSEAGDVAHEDLIRSKGVTVGASGWLGV